MLRYLLDEHISPVVAEAVRRKHGTIWIESIHRWRGGTLVGASDSEVLRNAYAERLTLVTYDLQTIPDLLAAWAEEGIPHSGVVLVDGGSIAPADFGGLARALIRLWQQRRTLDWLNRPVFLNRA
jgi:predicted nuclease of predicted toxin-antitoxin system